METRQIGKITGFSIVTALLYNVGFLSPFFAVPLQLSAAGRNRNRFLLSSLVSMFLILSFRASILSPLKAQGFVYIDAYILILAIAGLYVCNFELKSFSLPVRIAVITAAAAVISLLLLPTTSGLRDQIIISLDQIMMVSKELNLTGTVSGSDGGLTGETLFLILQDLAGSTGFVWYFFFIALSHWMGKRMMLRFPDGRNDIEQDEWNVPEAGIWFLFIPLTLFMLNKLLLIRGVRLLGTIPYYAVTNLVLIAAGTYGVRGIRIIQAVLKNKGISRQMQRILFMTAGFLIIMPGINLGLLILIAGIGVSELWVNYRLFDKE